MKYIDVNCMVGGWPFHRVRNSTFADLKRMHEKLGITGGYVSSTEGIFWNDPYEADLLLAEQLKGQQDYKQIMTVNPTLVGWRDDLDRAERDIKPVGVRVTPGFHGYTLDHPEFQALAEELAKRGLAMWLTVHMEDERVAYLIKYSPVPPTEIKEFIEKNPNLTILLANIRAGEVDQLESTIAENSNVFFDISGFKDKIFLMQDVIKKSNADRMCYGSMSPIFCINSTHLLIEGEPIAADAAAMVRAAEAFTGKLEK